MTFINLLGISFVIVATLTINFLSEAMTSDWITENWKATILYSFIGSLSVAVSIRDGQFIYDVKSNHWFSREMVELRDYKREKRITE